MTVDYFKQLSAQYDKNSTKILTHIYNEAVNNNDTQTTEYLKQLSQQYNKKSVDILTHAYNEAIQREAQNPAAPAGAAQKAPQAPQGGAQIGAPTQTLAPTQKGAQIASERGAQDTTESTLLSRAGERTLRGTLGLHQMTTIPALRLIQSALNAVGIETKVGEKIAKNVEGVLEKFRVQNPDTIIDPETVIKFVIGSVPIFRGVKGATMKAKAANTALVGATEAILTTLNEIGTTGEYEGVPRAAAVGAATGVGGSLALSGLIKGTSFTAGEIANFFKPKLAPKNVERLRKDLRVSTELASELIYDYQHFTGKPKLSEEDIALVLLAGSGQKGTDIMQQLVNQNPQLQSRIHDIADDIRRQIKGSVAEGGSPTEQFSSTVKALKVTSDDVNYVYNGLREIGNKPSTALSSPQNRPMVDLLIQHLGELKSKGETGLSRHIGALRYVLNKRGEITISELMDIRNRVAIDASTGRAAQRGGSKSLRGVLDEIINQEFQNVDPRLADVYKNINLEYTLASDLGIGGKFTEDTKNQIAWVLSGKGKVGQIKDVVMRQNVSAQEFINTLYPILRKAGGGKGKVEGSNQVIKRHMNEIAMAIGPERMMDLEKGLINIVTTMDETLDVRAAKDILNNINLQTAAGKDIKNKINKIYNTFNSILDADYLSKVSYKRGMSTGGTALTPDLTMRAKMVAASTVFGELSTRVKSLWDDNAKFHYNLRQVEKSLQRMKATPNLKLDLKFDRSVRRQGEVFSSDNIPNITAHALKRAVSSVLNESRQSVDDFLTVFGGGEIPAPPKDMPKLPTDVDPRVDPTKPLVPDTSTSPLIDVEIPQLPAPTTKRGRGRPRKNFDVTSKGYIKNPHN